ncbi:MAG: CCA tRNA nucleotidyltransferase [Microthrixaceae bacterium]|nr:CCA tRNA nucleotidyltransferase [Microthrixaceae bacterium]
MIPPRARPIIERVRPVAERFEDAGHHLYLVGGAVRDLFVDVDGVEHEDLDLTTDATPEVVKGLLAPLADALWTQGERFGTIGATIGGDDFEVTTHRAEVYDPESRKPQVAFRGTDLVTDLSRRDFTINAMALEVTGDSPTLSDPFDGLGDLMARRLRTPLDPTVSFTDDPLRMMRAARFVARFSLVPDEALVSALEAGSQRLGIVSPERVRDELCKLVVIEDPTDGLWFFNDHGLAEQVLPELPAMRVEQDPIHRHKDVLTHTVAVVRQSPPDLRVRLAALFHDVGKPRTRAIGARGVSFHHHEVVGARMTRKRMKALHFANDLTDDVTQLVYLHLRMHTYQLGWTDSAVRRFVRDAGDLLEELLALTRADCTTRNKRKAEALSRRIDELEDRIAELATAEELQRIRPDLNGNEVMEHLGIPGGPVVGEALEHLLEVRLEQGPLTSEEARAELDRWWEARGGS